MPHTKAQRIAINFFGITTVFISFLWVTARTLSYFGFTYVPVLIKGIDFIAEPYTVCSAALVVVFNFCWPDFARKDIYYWEKINVFENYTEDDGEFLVGEKDYEFTLQFSKGNGENIFMYNHPPNIESIALARDFNEISEIKDASEKNRFDFSKRYIETSVNKIVILKNKKNYFACVKINRIDNKRADVSFEIVINKKKGGTNFWNCINKWYASNFS